MRTRNVLLASAVLALLIAPLGMAASGKVIRLGKRNGTAHQETRIMGDARGTDNNIGGYTTRQSNLSDSGGGAFYGCRAQKRTTTTGATEPCLRANNLSTGFAFEFNATNGDVGGTFQVGGGGDAKKPFTTNATGVATGLNADRVDGSDASQLKTRWVLINEKGEIEEQSGGFKVVDAYATDDNVYIDAGSSLEGHALTATISPANKGATPTFGGEIAAARCQTAALDCAPAAAKSVNAFVVSPRNSDGKAPAGTATDPRKRFYVTISE